MAKEKQKNLAVKETLVIFWHELLKHRPLALAALCLQLGIISRTIIAPFLVSILLARLIQRGGDTMPLLIWFSVASLGGVALELIGIRATMRLNARMMNGFHDTIFHRMLKRSTGYYADRISGKLISDVYDFMGSFSNFVNVGFISGLSVLLTFVIGLTIIMISAWQLGVILAIMIILTLYLTMVDARKRSGLRAVRLVATKNLTAHTSDNIVNIQTVKTFGREPYELERSKGLSKRLGELRERDWVWATTGANLRNGMVLVFQLAMLFVLIELVQHDAKFIAAGIFAFTYTLTVSGRLFELNTIVRQLEDIFLQTQPITEMLSEPIEITDKANAKELQVKKGKIEFKDVTFTYGDKKNQLVFHNLSFIIKPGQKIGLVGPSGGGKSTLTKLLLRFEDIDNGKILIDGHDITDVTQESLRKSISYVPQEPLLFHRSIKENIAYGKPEASDEEIIKAAKTAFAHDFIEGLPNGYETIVGERGAKLSGGQRQRVAIARAILENAPILLLDEATSALDSESEVYIQQGLAALMANKTTIVVAHRLSTIQYLDRIIVLKDGAIVEDGSHNALLKDKGLYAKLWKHQSGGFIEE